MIIQENKNLINFNTFAVPAQAKYFTTITTLAEAQQVIASTLFKSEPHLFLGGGSNILFTKNFEGLVVKVALEGIDVLREDDEHIVLKVCAGVNWHTLVMHCVDKGLGGLENLSLIPGTVGAAPIQNIGAYGVEVKNNILEVEALHRVSGDFKTFSNEACHFGYRQSIFKLVEKDKYLITSVTFTLTKQNHRINISYGAIEETLSQQGIHNPTIKDVSNAVIQIRRSKLPDPVILGNAGSFFKNPSISDESYLLLHKAFPSLPAYPTTAGFVKIPAAWLIEQCNWKGKRVGNIGVHVQQALVLVNYGGGNGEEIAELSLRIQSSVKEKFNVLLQPEVNIL